MMNPSKRIYLDRNLLIVFGITLMAVMGVATLTPAFPKILVELKLSTQAIGMLITSFTLPGVILTPVLGILADRYGRKKILVPSLILFGFSGGACTFVRDFHMLLILRFLQGVGAASLGSLNATIIGDLYQGKERTSAMGYNASVLSIGTASYPVLGGALAMFGWYYPFLLPMLAIPLGFIVLFFLKNPEPKNRQRLGVQFIGALKRMANRQVLGIFFASVILFLILYGPYLTYFPLLMGKSFNASPLEIALIFTVMSLATALTSSQIGRITTYFHERSLIRFAFLLYGTAVFLIPLIPRLWLLPIPAMIFGFAHGTNLPCLRSLLAGLSSMEYRATFMSVNGMVLRLGQTLGPLLAGMVFSFWGMAATFYSAAGLGVLMFLLSFIMIREPHSQAL
jgi:ACDE family multidrug resistance protein